MKRLAEARSGNIIIFCSSSVELTIKAMLEVSALNICADEDMSRDFGDSLPVERPIICTI